MTRAGHRKPPNRRERRRGLQHEVKPAASTEKQRGSRAAHFTAKAKPAAQESGAERVAGPSGVGGAARVEGDVRNRRGPSARPESGRNGSYKPKVKSSVAQRESEGVVVPGIVVKKNATGGKGPCGGRAGTGGKREGMTGESRSNHPGGPLSVDKVRGLQRRLWRAAKRQPGRRFHALYDRIYRDDVLRMAWERVKDRKSGGRRCRDDRRPRAARNRELPRGASDRAGRRKVPTASGLAAVHPEGRWEKAAAWDTGGEGPGGPDGGEAGTGADLRGGFPRLVSRIPAAPERDRRTGGPAQARSERGQPRAGRGHRGLLRKHRPRASDEASGKASLGPTSAQALAAVAEGGCDGRGAAPRDGLGGRRRAG